MGSLTDRIKHHEGFRLFPYQDTLGNWTIGYGHKMDTVSQSIREHGITLKEAEHLFDVDMEIAKRGAIHLGIACDETRFGVLVEIIFQLGLAGVMKFKKMLAALEIGDYEKAADEMLDSKWNSKTPERCRQLSMLMREGNEFDV